MTPEQQALLRKSQRSLDAAKILQQEGLFEFAVSRAYYSMFYIAQAFLLGKGLTFSSHAAVISAFGKQFARTELVLREFHRVLIAAERIRLKGDYDIDSDLQEADALEQIIQAERFLELAEQLLNEGFS